MRPLSAVSRVSPPRCGDCPSYYQHQKREAERVKGIMVEPGERICFFEQRPRRFKKKDAQFCAPKWCAKRYKQCIMRLYSLTGLGAWKLDSGMPFLPLARDYELRAMGETDYFSPSNFWDEIKADKDPVQRILGCLAHRYDLVELDDGLTPRYFFRRDGRWYIVRFHDATHLKREFPAVESKVPGPTKGSAGAR